MSTDTTPVKVSRPGRRFAMVYADTLHTEGLSAMARLVYVELALHADTDRDAWPSPARMATNLAVARSTIYAALAELEAAGIITRTARTTPAGADAPTLITIHDADPQGSVRHPDTSVRHTDGSVRHTDTRSVRHTDTNIETKEHIRARAHATPVPDAWCRQCQRPHPTGAHIDPAERQARGDHAAGAAAIRAAAQQARSA